MQYRNESQHFDCDSAAAEVQKDVTELDFSQVCCLLNGCEHGKSHSCNFLRIHVDLAEGVKLFYVLFYLLTLI